MHLPAGEGDRGSVADALDADSAGGEGFFPGGGWRRPGKIGDPPGFDAPEEPDRVGRRPQRPSAPVRHPPDPLAKPPAVVEKERLVLPRMGVDGERNPIGRVRLPQRQPPVERTRVEQPVLEGEEGRDFADEDKIAGEGSRGDDVPVCDQIVVESLHPDDAVGLR